MQDSAVATFRATRATDLQHMRRRFAQALVDHARLQGSRTVAVAMATRPSPRPVKPDFLAGRGLDRHPPDRNAGDRGDARAHRIAMRADAGHLADNRNVEMRDHAGAGAHAIAGESEKAVRRSAAPLRIAGREMHPDIALSERAQYGVDQRMQRHVGVRMTGYAAGVRNAAHPPA